MQDLDVLVPSALLPVPSRAPDLAAELLRDAALPTLARVASHASRTTIYRPSIDTSLATWQAWLCAEPAGAGDRSVNIAEAWATALGVAAHDGTRRWLLEPAHFRIARDHLRLDDPALIDITLDEARGLAAAAESILAAAGWRLATPDSTTSRHWFATRDDASSLAGSSIERAIADNVAAWQPRCIPAVTPDADALAWRRCVNEIQMAWYVHPVNGAREARGVPPVNTLWLSGNGHATTARPRYATVDSTLPLVAAAPLATTSNVALESVDGFIEPTRQEAWGTWREEAQALDARLATLVERQAAGELGTVTLVLCGDACARVVTLRRGDLRSVWRRWRRWRRRTALADLLGEPEAA